jgi:hypothetical protein
VTDTGRRSDETTTREWIRALVVVGLGAILTTALLIWFAFTFVLQACCASPSPGV